MTETTEQETEQDDITPTQLAGEAGRKAFAIIVDEISFEGTFNDQIMHMALLEVLVHVYATSAMNFGAVHAEAQIRNVMSHYLRVRDSALLQVQHERQRQKPIQEPRKKEIIVP